MYVVFRMRMALIPVGICSDRAIVVVCLALGMKRHLCLVHNLGVSHDVSLEERRANVLLFKKKEEESGYDHNGSEVATMAKVVIGMFGAIILSSLHGGIVPAERG